MTLTRRAREWVIVAVLIALPVLFLRANLKSPSDINWLDRAVLRISSPIEAALTWIGRGLGHVWSRYIYLVHLERDNEALRDENARLRSELVAAHQQAERGGELERLLKLRSTLPSG